ncbi:MAG: MBL fold metallo-hydrolase [Erysipelotrichaceae bacterium]|nr:MBL fold metallo-hydrolase [Erysipelotrichaceae bacterium]
MKLEKISNDIYLYPFEEARDRPALSLICGKRLTLAIDPGHSREHVEEFYDAVKKAGLPLPDITVLTHWHWDHSFGIHAVHGITAAERRSLKKLDEIKDDEGFIRELMNTNEYFAREFACQKVCVELPQLVFDDALDIDLGNLHAHCFHVPSAHTDDCTCILIEEEGIIYLGDCISGVYPDWVIDPVPYRQLIEVLRSTDFRLAVGSHWPPFGRDELFAHLEEELQTE